MQLFSCIMTTCSCWIFLLLSATFDIVSQIRLMTCFVAYSCLGFSLEKAKWQTLPAAPSMAAVVQATAVAKPVLITFQLAVQEIGLWLQHALSYLEKKNPTRFHSSLLWNAVGVSAGCQWRVCWNRLNACHTYCLCSTVNSKLLWYLEPNIFKKKKKSTDQCEIILDWVVSNLRMYWDDCRFLSLESILILVSGTCSERCRYHTHFVRQAVYCIGFYCFFR